MSQKLFTVQVQLFPLIATLPFEGAVARRITACPIITFDEQSHSQPILDIVSRF